jgi:hypothetical protein
MTDAPIPDDEHGADLPMNMTASVMLTGLPRDAHQALADVEGIDAGKGRTPIYSAAVHSTCFDTNDAGVSDQRLDTSTIHDLKELTQLPSDCPLPAAPISPHSEKSGV